MASPKYSFCLIADDHIEDLIERLNKLGKDGWYVVSTIQEHAFTKVLLQKETKE